MLIGALIIGSFSYTGDAGGDKNDEHPVMRIPGLGHLAGAVICVLRDHSMVPLNAISETTINPNAEFTGMLASIDRAC